MNQENAFYFEGIVKLEQRWAKCIALKGDFQSLVARSAWSLERFDRKHSKSFYFGSG